MRVVVAVVAGAEVKFMRERPVFRFETLETPFARTIRSRLRFGTVHVVAALGFISGFFTQWAGLHRFTRQSLFPAQAISVSLVQLSGFHDERFVNGTL